MKYLNVETIQEVFEHKLVLINSKRKLPETEKMY